MSKVSKASIYALLAASFYAINAPISKILLVDLSPTMMSALLYLGGGLGMLLVSRMQAKTSREIKLSRTDWPYIVGIVVLDILAPIFLMTGLTMTHPANVSLLNNFEIVATSIIAWIFFKEVVSKRLWVAIILITVASIILTFEGEGSLHFSLGSFFVILASLCWGLENNCTRMLSSKDPIQVVVIKGLGSGLGSLMIAAVLQELSNQWLQMGLALLLGFVTIGLSVTFYVYAQRDLGASKTSAYYAINPFIGAAISLVFFRQSLTVSFVVALAIMIVGTYLTSTDQTQSE